MLIRPGRSSGNLIDRRGGGGGGRGGRVGLGLGGLVLVLVLGTCFGIDITPLLGGGGVSQAPANEQASAPTDDASRLVDAVLVETEDVWGELYRQSGDRYEEPNLVLFTGQTPTGCGYGQAAMGPFYCPSDQSVYIDLSFFNQLQRMGAEGEFAIAYVIAHEVAHHVQNLEGLLGRSRSNAMSVQTELQADCLAGIWTHHAEGEDGLVVLNDQDIQSGISAAAAVGDDAIQRGAGQAVRPESFTHGSSRQRVDAFLTGYRSGDYGVCFD
ncbi:neutral zinc metallopeptidase [Rubrivirga sp. IMCC43871]|uniref:KPN_02809 family neutral zinc metallopeptidase n=1 Tax=Rubrivirga sp. IMCC43871 TaxID=3391575 RepID=UPI00398FA9EF